MFVCERGAIDQVPNPAKATAGLQVLFFWKQEKMNINYTQECIVEESYPALIIANTEKYGIAEGHRKMCPFDRNTSQGSQTFISDPRRC